MERTLKANRDVEIQEYQGNCYPPLEEPDGDWEIDHLLRVHQCHYSILKNSEGKYKIRDEGLGRIVAGKTFNDLESVVEWVPQNIWVTL